MYGPASIIATGVILPLFGVVAVILRFYVRLRVHPAYIGIDDWMIAISSILVCALGANQISAAVLGELGRDGLYTVPARVYINAKASWAEVVIEKLVYGAIKLSVLLFYRRVFPSPTFHKINTIIIVFISFWTVAYFLSEVFVCGGHPEIQWKGPASRPGCVDQSKQLLSFAVTDVIGDIAVLAMPYPCLRKLHISRREKFGVIAIFMLGTLSIAAGIVRLGFVAKAFTTNYGAADSGNKNGSGTPPWFWTTVEVSVGVLAACLPALGPLLRRAPSPRRLISYIYDKMSLSHTSQRHAMDAASPRMMEQVGLYNGDALTLNGVSVDSSDASIRGSPNRTRGRGIEDF